MDFSITLQTSLLGLRTYTEGPNWVGIFFYIRLTETTRFPLDVVEKEVEVSKTRIRKVPGRRTDEVGDGSNLQDERTRQRLSGTSVELEEKREL